MKRPLLLFYILIFSLTAKSQEIKLDSLQYHLGKIKKGEDYKLKIPFMNVGEKPLFIEAVQAASSDAVGNWQKEPVLPNGKGFVEVKFMTNRPGKISQYFIIVSNSVIENQKRIPITVKFEITE